MAPKTKPEADKKKGRTNDASPAPGAKYPGLPDDIEKRIPAGTQTTIPEEPLNENPQTDHPGILKSLDLTDLTDLEENIPDVKVFGNPDTFKLISKVSSEEEGWMKSTKAMYIPGLGCLVQVTTQQRNPDYSYSIAEALTFVPRVHIEVYKPEMAGDVGEPYSILKYS